MLSEKEIRNKWEHKLKLYAKTGADRFLIEAIILEEVLQITAYESDYKLIELIDQQ